MHKDFIRELFIREGYMWSYPYESKPHSYFPHALLTSGKHSDFFANITAALHEPRILNKIMRATNYDRVNIDFDDVDFIMCPGYGAVAFACALSMKYDIPWGYTDKVPFTMTSSFEHGTIQKNKRFDIKDQNVLIVEDVITTAGSVCETISAVISSGGKPLSNIFVVLDRSKFSTNETLPFVYIRGKDGGRVNPSLRMFNQHFQVADGLDIQKFTLSSIIKVEAQTWESDECPLCKEGSKALKPKANWDQFMGGTGSNG